jgi:hypothetical protein
MLRSEQADVEWLGGRELEPFGEVVGDGDAMAVSPPGTG